MYIVGCARMLCVSYEAGTPKLSNGSGLASEQRVLTALRFPFAGSV